MPFAEPNQQVWTRNNFCEIIYNNMDILRTAGQACPAEDSITTILFWLQSSPRLEIPQVEVFMSNLLKEPTTNISTMQEYSSK